MNGFLVLVDSISLGNGLFYNRCKFKEYFAWVKISFIKGSVCGLLLFRSLYFYYVKEGVGVSRF